jgi:AraC-like DNA-binding protein
MRSVHFGGGGDDLERFARDVLQRRIEITELGPFERRMSWSVPGSSGVSSAAKLRSGIALSATRLAWDRASMISMNQAATPLKFSLSRGAGPRMTPAAGRSYVLGQGTFQVSQVKRRANTTCEFVEGGGQCENVALELDGARLKELLGTTLLPQPVEALLSSPAVYVAHEQPMNPALFRLLDEIIHCDARGASRQLYLEAKGLEVVAVMIDELEAASSPVSRSDVERLQRARGLLLSRMEAPPSLPELARLVGLNEVKLKTGFRALFGSSVYAYLRRQRLEAARDLLLYRHLSVTEAALRVGYSNPSKFAAAFRKQFGVPPSALR